MRLANENPFRTSQLAALPWLPIQVDLENLFEEWQKQSFRGQINGLHGAGKSTLSLKLSELAESHGFVCQRLFANLQSNSKVFKDWQTILAKADSKTLFILDGIGHAPARHAQKWLSQCPHFLAIAHKKMPDVPQLAHLKATANILEDLVFILAGDEGNKLLKQINGANFLFEKHAGNLRDCLFELYSHWSNLD